MNSSGIKRGLATTAISALAVTGLPFLASSASATPLETRTAADSAEFYSQQNGGISDLNDGTNETVSLVAGGGENVTSILFQYRTSLLGDWNDVPGGVVARNADGVFAAEWTNPPANVQAVRAVPDTDEANSDVETVSTVDDATAETVELATEGALGVFQSPYSDPTPDGPDADALPDPARDGQYVIADGTTSEAGIGVTVSDASHGTAGPGTATSTDADGNGAGTTGVFSAIVDIEGYPYSTGGETNQIALNGETSNTDDAEGSTLYRQTITTLTAEPETQEVRAGDPAEITLTVTDQNGNPVANAQIGRADGPDTDTDGAGADTDTDTADVILGYTDAHGEFVTTQTAAGTSQFYVNTTDTDAYEAGTDPTDSATVTTYTAAVTTVDIVNERSRSNFDLDEFGTNLVSDDDDFTIETQDQRGEAFGDGDDIQYRFVVDPAGAAVAETSNWISATDGNNDGVYEVGSPIDADWQNPAIFTGHSAASGDLPSGSYTIEARRPNDPGTGTGLLNASPESFTAGESEISFDEGDSATATVEGDTTLTGTLALIDGGAGLGNREFVLTFGAGREDAKFVDGPGVDANAAGTSAVVVTDADGGFSVVVDDAAGPSNVPDNEESATVIADSTQETPTDGTLLKGDNGAQDPAAPSAAANAADQIVVNFVTAPEVDSIEIADDVLDDYSYFDDEIAAPGSPVELDVTVFTADGSDPGTDPDEVQDYPVTFTVDKGFLSPHAEDADDLTLADGHDAEGDLWGFFESLGSEETVSTGDSAEAGIVAAIEDDADFDDNGMTTMTVTVTAGDVTEEFEIDFDSRNFLNLANHTLEPSAGEPSGTVPTNETVDFDLMVEDQFGNLVGDHQSRISDDSTVADFTTDEDFDTTLTDFTTSGPGITAFSDAPTVQVLTGTMDSQTVTVDANGGAPDVDGTTDTVDSEPINWVEPEGDGPINAGLTLRGGDNGAADDSLFANAHRQTEGAVVKLFRRKSDGTWKFIRKGIMNAEGNFRFKDVNDLNGNKVTRYKAIVKATDDTRRGVGKKRVR